MALEASRVTSAAVEAARAETERRKVESLELGSLENEFFQLLCSVSKELQRVTEERAKLFAEIRIKVIYSLRQLLSPPPASSAKRHCNRQKISGLDGRRAERRRSQ